MNRKFLCIVALVFLATACSGSDVMTAPSRQTGIPTVTEAGVHQLAEIRPAAERFSERHKENCQSSQNRSLQFCAGTIDGESRAELAAALALTTGYLRQSARLHAEFFDDEFSVPQWEEQFLETEEAWTLIRDEQCQAFYLAGGRESGLWAANCRSQRNQTHAAELLSLLGFGGGPRHGLPSAWWDHLGEEAACSSSLRTETQTLSIEFSISEEGIASAEGSLNDEQLTMHGASSRGHENYLGVWRTGPLNDRPTRAGYWWILDDQDEGLIGALIEFAVDDAGLGQPDPTPIAPLRKDCPSS